VDPKRRILAYLRRRRSATSGELQTHLGLSRQALNNHIRSLIRTGEVIRSGTTRGARYWLASRAPAAAVVTRSLDTRGLEEDRVWENLATHLNLPRVLRPNVEAITRYAFTEMLNNAIEHSEADRCTAL
jgi:biotin operon repressor